MADVVATAPISSTSSISIWELSIPAVCLEPGIGGKQLRELDKASTHLSVCFEIAEFIVLDKAFTHLSVCFEIEVSTLLSKKFNFKSLSLSS